MTPAARVQAAIEILDDVFAAIREDGPAADVLIARYFRTRRYAGSKDRAAVRHHVYAALRAAPSLAGATGRGAIISLDEDGNQALFGLDQPHAPAAITAEERRTAFDWRLQVDPFLASLDLDSDLMAALQQRAPLDLRVNTLKATRAEVLAELAAQGARPALNSPLGVRIDPPFNIEQHATYLEGRVDIQDDGSQMVAMTCAARPGDVVIDLCAGGGGKAVALAAIMQNRGQIIASDISAARLARIAPRAARLGISIIETQAPDSLRSGADIVLVDAPCTGSGTWRRNPEVRLRLTQAYLNRMVSVQADVLDRAAALVRPGGRLVFAVCSWIPAEGPEQLAAFQARHSGFKVVSVQSLRPDINGCDAFFIASLEKPC